MSTDTFFMLWGLSVPTLAIIFTVLFRLGIMDTDDHMLFAFITTLLFPLVVICFAVAGVLYGIAWLISEPIKRLSQIKKK